MKAALTTMRCYLIPNLSVLSMFAHNMRITVNACARQESQADLDVADCVNLLEASLQYHLQDGKRR